MSTTTLRDAAEAHWRDRGLDLRAWISVRRLQGRSYATMLEEMLESLGWGPSAEALRRWGHDSGVHDSAGAKVYLACQGLSLDEAAHAADRISRGEATLAEIESALDREEGEDVYHKGETPWAVIPGGRDTLDPAERLRRIREGRSRS